MTTQFDEQHDETMAAIIQALETAPVVQVPQDFASRVMARVPESSRGLNLRRARALTPRYGRTAAFVGLAVVLGCMLLLARTHGEAMVFLQFLLLFQLSAYVLWIGFASWRSQ